MKTSDTARKIVVFWGLMQRQLTFVEFDARKALVPARYVGKPSVTFQYGLPALLTVPIPDLEVTVEGIHATLSFDRTPHDTFVPWSAVLSIVGNDGFGAIFSPESTVEKAEPETLRCTTCGKEACGAECSGTKQAPSNVVPLFKNRS